MGLPKIKFIDVPLSKEIDWIYGFLFKNQWNWNKYILKKHPQLKEVYSLKTEKDRVKFIKQHTIQYRHNNQQKIICKKNRIEKHWKKVEKQYLITLSETINIKWPRERKIITAMISINPICPRFLNNWSFFLYFNYKIKYQTEIIMHEICHFLYFEKWKEIFPSSNKKTFEYPHIEWHLSELIAPIILNNSRIKKYLKHKADFYDEHKRIKINNIAATEYFSVLYDNCTKNNENFDSFIKKAYAIIRKNKKQFLNIKK